MVCLQLSVAKDLVQAAWRVGQEVKSNNPEAEGDIEDGLQGDDLGDDHPGVPHCVSELSCHFYIDNSRLSPSHSKNISCRSESSIAWDAWRDQATPFLSKTGWFLYF